MKTKTREGALSRNPMTEELKIAIAMPEGGPALAETEGSAGVDVEEQRRE